MPVSKRTNHLILPILLVLSGCGGGGAGTGNGNTAGTTPPSAPPVTPPPVASATLKLTEADTYYLQHDAIRAADEVLVTGHYVVEMAQRFKTNGAALSQKIPCAGGEQIVTLTDNDGNGIASAGDRLTVQANTCSAGVNGDPAVVTLNAYLQAGTLPAEDRLTALIEVADGVAPDGTPAWLSGSFTFGWERSALAQSWKVSASAKDDLKIIDSLTRKPVFLRAPAVTKDVDYVKAHSEVSLAMRYEAGAGSALVSTVTPLASALQHDPAQGTIEIRGANGVIRVTTEPDDAGASLAIADLLLENATSPAKTEKFAWIGYGRGFLWWDGQRRTFQGELDFQTVRGDAGWNLTITDPASAGAPDAVFRLQFVQPPAALAQLFFRFSDITATIPLLHDIPPTLPPVGATAEAHGALLLLHPAQALGPGRKWALEVSRDGVTWNDGGTPAPDVVVLDAEGHQLVFYMGYVGSIYTPAAR